MQNTDNYAWRREELIYMKLKGHKLVNYFCLVHLYILPKRDINPYPLCRCSYHSNDLNRAYSEQRLTSLATRARETGDTPTVMACRIFVACTAIFTRLTVASTYNWNTTTQNDNAYVPGLPGRIPSVQRNMWDFLLQASIFR